MMTMLGLKPKGTRNRLLWSTVLSGLVVAATPVLAQTVDLPSGGHVVAGSATISVPSTSQTVISQSSSKAIIDWDAFSIGKGNTVQFDNGSGATLNRVTGGNLSSIDGLLSATGSVYLINPNGVVIGKTGVVRTGGSFVAATQNLSDSDFMSGGDLTFDGLSNASIVNLGAVGSLGGNVVVIASNVENSGSLCAPKGTVGLLAGRTILMRDAATDQGLFVVATGGAETSLNNRGTIAGASAELRANGGSVYALAGNTDGLITATGVSQHDGNVWLVAGASGTLAVNETLTAIQANGDGGSVETSGGTVDFNGAKVDTTGRSGRTGTWLVDPYDLTVDATAANTISTNLATTNVTLQTTASGATGPGTANASGIGDINITSGITWSSGNTLTLDAYHSININSSIAVTGAGKVTLKTNDGGSGGDYNFGIIPGGFFYQGSLTYTGTGGALTINGHDYTLVYNLTQLDDIDGINSVDGASVTAYGSGLGGYYALANSFYANSGSAGNSLGNASLVPSLVGTNAQSPFSGVFTGLGNHIRNFTLTNTGNVVLGTNAVRGTYAGLFGVNTGTIRDLALGNEYMISEAYASGGLVGWNTGTLTNISLDGLITGNGDHAGGLVGVNMGGTISNVYLNVTVSSAATTYSSGGIAGYNAGIISNSGAIGYGGSNLITTPYTGNTTNPQYSNGGGVAGYNSGTVSNTYSNQFISGNGQTLGGVVGLNAGTVTSSHSTTWIFGGSIDVGGVVGKNTGTVSNSYFNGQGWISTSSAFGGVVGLNTGIMTSDYASADLSATNAAAIGDLVGVNSGSNAIIQNSYALGAVTDTGIGTNAGGLVGSNLSGAVIENSYANGTVTSSGAEVGGLVGLNSGSIRSSYYSTYYANGNVTASAASSDVGGLVGYNNGGTILTSYSMGTVSGSGFSAGGLVGKTSSGHINNNYSTGDVNGGATYLAGFIGYNATYDVTSNYWDTQTSGQTMGVAIGYSSGAKGLTSAQFTNTANFKGWSFTSTPGGPGWVIVDFNGSLNNAGGAAGGTRPILGSEYSTRITSGHQLQLMAMDLTASYKLIGSLNLRDTDTSEIWATSQGFLPIGTSMAHFTGSLDGMIGDGTISTFDIQNLRIGGSGTYYGLFGYSAGTISNLYLGNVSVNGSAYASGALAGWNDGIVTNVNVSGVMTGSGGSSHLGGLVGVNSGLGIITKSGSTVSINASTYSVGGLAGYNAGTLRFDNYSGSVSAQGSHTGGLVGLNWGGQVSNDSASGSVNASTGYSVGGLVGYSVGTVNDSNASVTVTGSGVGQVLGGLIGYNRGISANDYATGFVQGTGSTQSVGGAVGWNDGALSSIAASGTISGNGASSHVGGLAGVNNSSATIADGYATGPVTGSGNDIGGLVGYNSGSIARTYSVGSVTGSATYSGGLIGYSPGTVSASYWDTLISGKTNATGAGSASGVTGQTTSALTNGTLPSGFSNSVWSVNNGQYPYITIIGVH